MTRRAPHVTAAVCGISIAVFSPLNRAAGPVTVPMQIRGNFPIITVIVDGEPVPLIFDSGDNASLVLSQTARDRIKAAPTGTTQRMHDAKGNVIESPEFRVARVQIATATFADVIGRLDAHDPSFMADQVGQQGYFGRSLLKSFKVVLDYPHRTMTLIAPDTVEKGLPACRGTTVPFLPDWKGEPVTTAQTDFGTLTLVWDTGAPVSLIRQGSAAEAQTQAIDEAITTQRFDLSGSAFGPLQFQKYDFTELPGVDGFVGHNFFSKHVVCIDFPGQRLLVRPS